MSCSPQLPRPEEPDSSDYGSDFTPDEEELVNELLARAAEDATERPNATSPLTPIHVAAFATEHPSSLVATSLLANFESLQPAALSSPVEDIEDGIQGVRLPKVLGRQMLRSPWRDTSQQAWVGPPGSRSPVAEGASQGAGNRSSPIVEDPISTEGRERERERGAVREEEWTRVEQLAPTLDSRTPVERFRRPPNKAFSVTDLVSPAWCELQYWYTLTKHGRKRRTPAMKKGSVVHKALEDEIYTTVPVEITTKEDAWALRIWNVIQGLRMLREYGVTRELEVWGIVDGELVNGVIDQLSYECPDSELEATAARYYADAVTSRAVLPEYQMSLSDFLLSSSQGGRRLSDLADIGVAEEVPPSLEDPTVPGLPRIYMTDVKTKASGSVPTIKSTSFRPTLLQLQLYYHMLNRLITTDDVTIDVLAARYDLDPQRSFTEAFISEVSGLNDEYFDAASSQEFDLDDVPTPDDAVQAPLGSGPAAIPSHASQDSTSILLTHGTLSSLWKYMKEQLRYTFIPSVTDQALSVAPSIPSHIQPEMLAEYPTLLSPVLTARFLSSAPTTDLRPKLLGSRSFLFDPATMTSYLTKQMEWWRGQRDPNGVGIVEAWKCRICEFRDECTWRQEREWDIANRNRRRRMGFSSDI
ncbi:hypothetical protein N7462_005751 [Penicillium macrosclerotiorum]|uniref:uncharacterized protein n=1 Tax=Penicillium macrosclerotiorum TaxID=303699 RepID=UPI00254883B6|nr:uncharacterized protein N7462_005751 [Penicillium macrosclerotiorum]KAJ5682586.1 hypothetical protein N7462_005751 [Penicillium macrosclerotiorum]